MFAQSAPRRREPDYHVPPHDSQHRSTQEHRHAQCSGLPIRLAGRDLMLVEAQQVEREQDRQERRLRGKERLQAEPIGGQIVLQLVDPLLDTSPTVIVAP